MKRKLSLFIIIMLVSVSSWLTPIGSNNRVAADEVKSYSSIINPLFPWNKPGFSSPILYNSHPFGAGMVEKPLEEIDSMIEMKMKEGMMPGAVTFVARKGQIVKHDAYGYAAKYVDNIFTEMDKPIEMKKDSIFDVASISKLFTSTAAMMLYEKGAFQLNDPVAKHIPEFAQNGKDKVTIQQLLTHTSGFTPGIPLYKQGTNREDRLQIVFKQPLVNQPGSTYMYSDLNLITLGALIEKWSGKRQDVYVKENITNPLGMKDTMYNPPAHLKDRIVATEYQPVVNRGLVWGEVHDENTWSLDGVAGHAGVFSTAKDLGIFAHMYLNEGKYGSKRILKAETVKLMGRNFIPEFPGDDHGLGWELNQGWYMDALTDQDSLGHTGFTGTSIVVSPNNDTIAILLTNRVHPSRSTPSINPVRRSFARAVGDSIPVMSPWGAKAWFAGYGDNVNHSLTTEINLKKSATLSFDTWYRMETDSDYGIVEVSENGEQWKEATKLTGANGDWSKQKIELSSATKFVRLRYQTDASTNERGWYVNNFTLKSKEGKSIKMNWTSDGWTLRNY